MRIPPLRSQTTGKRTPPRGSQVAFPLLLIAIALILVCCGDDENSEAPGGEANLIEDPVAACEQAERELDGGDPAPWRDRVTTLLDAYEGQAEIPDTIAARELLAASG